MKETTNYKIRKPDPTDFFNIEEHFNHNADVIDNAIHNVETKLNNIDTTAEKTTLKDTGNNYNSNNVEGALIEIAEDISASKTSILDLQIEVNGQRLRGINIANTIIDKLEG